jgi:glycosyltransferase involved in cell wall biosynthesis
MRVSIVDPSAFTPPYDRSLAAALTRAGVDVELVTSRFLYGPVPAPEGYEVRRPFYPLSTRLGKDSRLRLPVKALEHPAGMLRYGLSRRGADVTHWQWVTLPAVDRFLVPPGRRRTAGGGKSKRPRVFTLHYPLPDAGDARAIRAQSRFLSIFDAVISHTESGALRLRNELGLDPDSVHVIPHGPLDYLPRIGHREPLPPEFAAADPDVPVVLFFGLLRPYKGIDTLLEAFAALDSQSPAGSAELWIAGMPRMPIEDLQELGRRAPGTVRWLPRFITDAEIPALMERADLLALPYRAIEQSGVLYAGLAFGKAMVLGDVGGFGELGRDHAAARLVPPGDVQALAAALTDLIADPVERERLETAARAAVSGEQGWDSIAARTIALYRSLLQP